MDERTLLDRPLAVSQINAMLRSLVKESFYNLCIEGEVSTFRPSANGHWYFRLKDERSQIDAVMFRSANAMASFIPRDGDLVLVKGSIDVYEARGTYQVIVQSIEHAGLGALLVQLEKRRQYRTLSVLPLQQGDAAVRFDSISWVQTSFLSRV